MNCSNRSELCSMYFKNNFSFSFFSCMQTTKNGRICSRIKVVYSSFELFWYFFHSEWFRMCSVKLCNLLNSMKMFDLCKSFHGTPADAFISIKNNDLRMCFVPHLQTFRVYFHCIWTISGLVFFCFVYPMDDTTHYSLSAIVQIKAFRVFAQNDDPIEPIFICVKRTFLFAAQIGFWIHWHVYSMHRWHGKHAISIKTCWNACLFILMLNVHVNLFT